MQGLRHFLFGLCLLSTAFWAAVAIKMIWTTPMDERLMRWASSAAIVTIASLIGLIAARYVRRPT